ncbi:nitrate reductase associated protein [Thermosynechococcus sp.]|uniref:nitrate reductase associated protein n=1 Tax=Thermosynechococcus sp. TaxID=2814275 RepID=UPI00391ABCBE
MPIASCHQTLSFHSPVKPRLITTAPPETVQQQLTKVPHHRLTREKWAVLTPLQRFVLVKLSQPGHENCNFWPALQEFGLT